MNFKMFKLICSVLSLSLGLACSLFGEDAQAQVEPAPAKVTDTKKTNSEAVPEAPVEESTPGKEDSTPIVSNDTQNTSSFDIKKITEELVKNSPFIPSNFNKQPEAEVQTSSNYEFRSVVKMNNNHYKFGLTDTVTKKGFFLSSDPNANNVTVPVYFVTYNEVQKALTIKTLMGDCVRLRLKTQSNKAKGKANRSFLDDFDDEEKDSGKDED